MKFRKVQCEECYNSYDPLEPECPYCSEPKPWSFKRSKVTVTPVWRQIFYFLFGFLGFQIIGVILSIIYSIIGSMTCTTEAELEAYLGSISVNASINMIGYAILGTVLICVSIPSIKKILKTFKHWTVPVAAIAGYVSIFVFNLIYSNFIAALGLNITDNANESTLNGIIGSYPILSLLIFGILGPLCEEITYRLGLYSFCKRINVYLAFAVTIVVFAFIHFDFTCFSSGTFVNELLNMPYYLVAAFVFTFIYEKFGFAASFISHSINNVVSIGLTIIVQQLS